MDEKILPHEFYRQYLNGKQPITAAVSEILDLASELTLPSESLDKHIENVAESFRLSMEKQGPEIRRQLISEWRDKFQEQELTTEEFHIMHHYFCLEPNTYQLPDANQRK